MNFLYYSLLLLFLVLACFLILLVLIQKGRGGGLSAAFGGVGGNTAFGAKTGDVLTWATSIIFGVFLLLAIGLNLIANHVDDQNKKVLIDNPATQPAAATDNSTPGPILTPTTNPAAAPPVDPATVPPPATEPANSTAQQVGKVIADKVAPATQPGR
jgi:preprotein translocase subunit SecG